ncbi:MAG: hypothetical protein MI863_04700 [Desulfobacterales bacterium]|nr:hypothetical protein [Desulfobacterales bacterium]
MTSDLFPATLFIAVTLLVLLEIPAAALGRLVVLIMGLRTAACFSGVLFVWISAARPPLYGAFEGLVLTLFIMGILALLYGRSLKQPKPFFLFHSLAALILLTLNRDQTMVLNPDYYMYGHVTVILFFTLRLAAAGIFAHGAVQYLHAGMEKEASWQGGRNTLLLGTCIYLASEWTGSLWALNWLGDSWQWSHGFFKAAILFLLVMTACHLPARVLKNRILHSLSGILPGSFLLWMIFYH